MSTHEDRPQPSREAFCVMDLLMRRGGSVRMGPLIADCKLPVEVLIAALNELTTRGWVSVVWRGPQARRPEALPERLRECRRVVVTRFGRWRYRTSWPAI